MSHSVELSAQGQQLSSLDVERLHSEFPAPDLVAPTNPDPHDRRPQPPLDRPRRRPRRFTEAGIVLSGDVIVTVAATFWLYGDRHAMILPVAAMIWLAWGLYSRRFNLSVLDDLPILGLGVASGSLLAMLWAPEGNRLTGYGILDVTLLFAGVVIARAVTYGTVRRRRARGRTVYPVIMVGAGPTTVALANRIANRPESGLETVGFVDDGPTGELPAPLLGWTSDLPEIVQQHQATDVIIGEGAFGRESTASVLRACYQLPVAVHALPRLPELHRHGGLRDHIWGFPIDHLAGHTRTVVSIRAKRVLDFTVAAVALLLASPVMAAVAVAVRLELGAGIIFKQQRIGLLGRTITVYKFRSMPNKASKAWSVAGSDEIGRVGRFIRRYSLDELPQLWSVLIGDMSLVGPRPERPSYVDQFTQDITSYADRHRVPVGLTGLAAVEGLRGDTSITERAYFDNLYIENWSLWFDLKIIFRTVVCVVRGTGG